MVNREAFGKSIQKYRKDKNISQIQLSRISGLDRSYISQVENGLTNITIDNIYKLSNALKVATSNLFKENLTTVTTKPFSIIFFKLGGTWDMVKTDNGLAGKGTLDDEEFRQLENQSSSERELALNLQNLFLNSLSGKLDLSSQLFWAHDLNDRVTGPFYNLFSGDSSHYRSALLAPILAILLKTIKENANKNILIAIGTDTVDLLLPIIDVFIFDKKAKPIFATGSNIAYRENYSDSPANFNNLVNALNINSLPGAYYVFNNTLYKASDFCKVDPSENPKSIEGMHTFYSPHNTQLNLIGFNNSHTNLTNLPKVKIENDYNVLDIFDAIDKILTVDLGLQNPIDVDIKNILDQKYKVIILKSHALGNVSNPIKKACLDAINNGTLVINISRCLVTNTSNRYQASLTSLNDNELNDSDNKVINGRLLNAATAKGIAIRALLDNLPFNKVQHLVNDYISSRF